ncbi:MAG: rod shape-determining protein MreC [Defluviitaleaceae bacterium]|nr:rod shape-determining protein MreC [Defluviitaleaceae bacterium]
MEFFRRNKTVFVVVAAVFLLIIAIITSGYRMRPNFLDSTVGEALVPAQRSFNNFADWLFGLPAYLQNVGELYEENEHLRSMLAEAVAENTRLRLLADEAEGLAELLAMQNRYARHPMTAARVVAAVSNNWFDAFTIDRGTNHGVERNMPVLAQGGLVGRVILSGNNYARVVSFLNIDEASAVSVRSIRTGEYGIIRGDIRLMPYGLVRMDYIDLGAQITIGDELVTSNLGDIFPPGISVGTVQEVRTDIGGLFLYAIISPSVNFRSIDTVQIITETFGGHLTDEGLLEED